MVSLRLLFISVVLLIAIISASLSASLNVAAADNEKVVKITKVSAVKNSEALVLVSLDSQKKSTDSKVTVSIPELGLRARRNVDFSKTNKESVHFEFTLPAALDPYVRIIFNSDEGRRLKHRPLLLE